MNNAPYACKNKDCPYHNLDVYDGCGKLSKAATDCPDYKKDKKKNKPKEEK